MRICIIHVFVIKHLNIYVILEKQYEKTVKLRYNMGRYNYITD